MQKIKEVLAWIFSLFALLCFVVLKPFSISNLLLLIAGLSIMPPIVRWLNKRKKYNEKIKWCLFIVLFLISIFIYSGKTNEDCKLKENTSDYVSQSEEQTKQQEKEKQKSSTNSNDNKNNNRTVYITPTGKRYHYSSECAGKNAEATTKDKAEHQGFTPCQKCVK